MKRILPPTTKRVQINTKKSINEKIHNTTKSNVEFHKNKGREAILTRLQELDYEWDIERLLEANSSTIILLSSIGFFIFPSPYWIVLIAFVSAFLLQHALQGWCPPLPIFRRLGYRTSSEIEEEKVALKHYI